MQLSKKGFTKESPRNTYGGFITSEQSFPIFSGAISINHCCFSVDDYHDNLFEEHGIYFPAEIGRAFVKRKAEFFAGRYCAKRSLSLLDGTIADIHISPQRYPLWPVHVVGSISHSGNQAIAVTARKVDMRGLGVDIQYEVDSTTCKAIKNQIIFGNEEEIILKCDEINIKTLFTIVFSAKESFFKAAFAEVGRYFDFSAVSVTKIDQRNSTILIRVNENLSKNLTIGTEIQAEYKHTLDKKIVTLVRLY